jgi:hypothetical protein
MNMYLFEQTLEKKKHRREFGKLFEKTFSHYKRPDGGV